ncbi:hypothetical protein, partial [Longispora fulva]|uniref:hypothetical protein n=1 Tax=Longispora fulva TaxID=619741 RepID=UPI003645582A
NSLRGVKELLNQHAIIVIEGDRTPQLKVLRELFPYHKYVHSISLKKNSGSGPFKEGTWQGGLKIIFIDPTWKQKICGPGKNCLPS